MQPSTPDGNDSTSNTPEPELPPEPTLAPDYDPTNPTRGRSVRVSLLVSPNAFVHLLFVRSVWGLDANGVPPVEIEPEPGNSQLPAHHNLDELNTLWRADWDRALRAYDAKIATVGGPDEATLKLLETSSDEELWQYMSAEPSPLWTSGVDAAALRRWLDLMHEGRWPTPEDTPEYRSLPALVGAWETGMTTIVQLPFAGFWAERVSTTHLMVSAPVRRDPMLFNLAFAL
jgi:hypothetical protein